MKILVTGAGGFLGRFTATAALERGHEVRALVRSESGCDHLRRLHPGGRIEVVIADLRRGASLDPVLDDIDVVVHLAGVKVGDLPAQFAGTVRPTEVMLERMRIVGPGRLVGVSTLALYDFTRLRAGETLTEESGIEQTPARRTAYVQTKLVQERLVAEYGAERDHVVAIVRPGMVYGPERLRHALLGIDVGGYHLRICGRRRLPMLYVEHGAEALVLAAEALLDRPEVVADGPLNLVDSELPTCREFAAAIAPAGDPRTTIPAPWTAMRGLVAAIDAANVSCFDGRAALPSVASRPELHARFKPLDYSNRRARDVLDWTPVTNWRAAVARSLPESCDTIPH